MNRARLIALVHAGPRALGWDETTRRAWMEKTVGKRSAKDCGEAELIHLVEALRVAGFRPAPPVKRPGGAGLNNSAAESAREFLYERDQDRAGQYRDGRAAQQTVKKGCKHGIR